MDRIPADDPRHGAPHAATPAPRRRLAIAVLVAVGLLGGAVVGGAMAVAHAGTSPPARSAPVLGGPTGARSSTGGTSPAASTGITIDQLDGSPDTTGAGDGRGDHDVAGDGRSVSDGFELRGDGGPASGR